MGSSPLLFFIDGFVKSPISALRTIFEESHVRLSTIDSSKIARALILSRPWRDYKAVW